MLVVAAAYPEPLTQRPDYLPVYGFMGITILSFYAVFILSVFQKKKLSELNVRLINEKKWHKIAYFDGLTGLKNRMAYIEKINRLERTMHMDDEIHAIMIDIDNFKKLNDALGHHIGDDTLIRAAEELLQIF